MPTIIVAGVLAALSSPSPALESCYKQAMQKTNADMAYLARKMCDELYKPRRRNIVVLDPKSRNCVEWWLDPRGRYESAKIYCAFEPSGDRRFTLACQDREKAGRVSLVEVIEKGETYERVGSQIGYDVGRLFKTLAACIRHKAAR